MKEAVIAALLTEPTIEQAAKAAQIGEKTIRRWLKLPAFRAAYDAARSELVDRAVAQMQAAGNEAVETLLTVMRTAAKDSDRVRAATAVLDRAMKEPIKIEVIKIEPPKPLPPEEAERQLRELLNKIRERAKAQEAAQAQEPRSPDPNSPHHHNGTMQNRMKG